MTLSFALFHLHLLAFYFYWPGPFLYSIFLISIVFLFIFFRFLAFFPLFPLSLIFYLFLLISYSYSFAFSSLLFFICYLGFICFPSSFFSLSVKDFLCYVATTSTCDWWIHFYYVYGVNSNTFVILWSKMIYEEQAI